MSIKKKGEEIRRTNLFTDGSSWRTWSKQLMGARKMMAFMSSKYGTHAARYEKGS
jgi:hypothetical protein